MPRKQPEQSTGQISRLSELTYITFAERAELGRARRKVTPRSAHGDWSPPTGRDMLALLRASNEGRVANLVPIRHARMIASP